MPLKKIGVLTGGGDAPGLNAVIRAVVKSANNSGVAVLGVEDSFDGGGFERRGHAIRLFRDQLGEGIADRG